jgi:hypothetical protein
MNNRLSDRVTEAVKTLGSEMKDAVDVVRNKLETAATTLDREFERITRLVKQTTQATVAFEVLAQTELGESVLVVGNHPSLGDWTPEQALALDGGAYPKWTGRIDVPTATVLEYKYVRKNRDGSFSWETIGHNRVLTAGPAGTDTPAREEARWL